MSEHVRTTSAQGVLEIVIDRPAKKNALDRAMYSAMADALDAATADQAIRAVLFTGAGGVFSSGNDISDFQEGAGGDSGPVMRLIRGVLAFRKPLVAAVEGLAVGIGTTLLLHCDLVYAGEGARFRTPFVDLALVPEFGSSHILPRLAGLQRAAEMLLLGEAVDAARAREIGFVNRVVPDGAALDAGRDAARRLAAKPPEAVAITRRLIRASDAEAAAARSEEEWGLFRDRLASREAQAAFRAFFARKAGA